MTDPESPYTRLAQIADLLVETDSLVSEMIVTALDDLRAMPRPEPVRYCGKRPAAHWAGSPCDRPYGHKGGCSYDVDRLVQMCREYETAAHKVPGLERQLTAATLERDRALYRLAEIELRHTPRRKLRPFAGRG